MNKKPKKFLGVLIPLLIVLSCSNIEEKTFPAKDFRPAEETDKNDLHYAYKNYLLACLALNNGNFIEAENYLKDAIQHDKSSSYLLAKLANLLVEAGKPKEALSYVEKAVNIEPNNTVFRTLLADVYSQLEKFDLAVSQYREILLREPGNKDIRLNLAAHLIGLKEFDAALVELSILIKNEPDFLMAYYYRGKTYIELKDYENATIAFLKAIDINPEFSPALFELADIYSNIGRPNDAIITYKTILDLYPSNIIAREKLIELYYDSGYDELADKYVNEIKRIINPGDIERKRLGLIYLRHERYEESISEFTSILALWPNNQEVLYYLGAAMEESGDLDNAYKTFDSIKFDSEYFIRSKIHMAYILGKQEKSEQAKILLKETIKKKPDKPELYLMLESIYEKEKDYLSARNTLEDGLKHNENNTDLLFSLGVVLDKLGENEKCIKHMELVINIEPNHAEALNYIGYTYADKGINLDRAQELIERAIKNRPDAGFIIDSLGWLYFKKGYYDKAIVELKKAVNLSPNDAAIKEHLGDVYYKINDFKNALEIYKDTLSLENAELDRLHQKINEIKKQINGDTH